MVKNAKNINSGKPAIESRIDPRVQESGNEESELVKHLKELFSAEEFNMHIKNKN